MLKMQQTLLTLRERIHDPFVQRLITLLVSGLIALLLGYILLTGQGSFVNHPVQWSLSMAMSIKANNTSV